MGDKYCTNCGTRMSAETAFCPQCGTKQDLQNYSAPSQQNMQGYGAQAPQYAQNYGDSNQQNIQNYGGQPGQYAQNYQGTAPQYLQGYSVPAAKKNKAPLIIAICAAVVAVVIGVVVIGIKIGSSGDSGQYDSAYGGNTYGGFSSSDGGGSSSGGVSFSGNGNSASESGNSFSGTSADSQSEPEESNVQNNVSLEMPTELTFQVSDKNGSELPVAVGEISLTGDGSYNQFKIEILTGEDLNALYTLDMTAMADMRDFFITAYIPVSDCADGLIYDQDYFASNGTVYFVSYNLADYYAKIFGTDALDYTFDFDDYLGDFFGFISDSLTIDSMTFVLYEYSPESYATFSLIADVTVDGTSYTLEAAGTADYMVEVQETCSVCNGSGVCRICHGSGENGLTGIWAGACSSCNGNKRCKYCDGTGYVSVMRSNR